MKRRRREAAFSLSVRPSVIGLLAIRFVRKRSFSCSFRQRGGVNFGASRLFPVQLGASKAAKSRRADKGSRPRSRELGHRRRSFAHTHARAPSSALFRSFVRSFARRARFRTQSACFSFFPDLHQGLTTTRTAPSESTSPGESKTYLAIAVRRRHRRRLRRRRSLDSCHSSKTVLLKSIRPTFLLCSKDRKISLFGLIFRKELNL